MSARYTVEITELESEEGWDYSRGVVRQGDRVLADVTRNYDHFPYLLVEDHPNGHDYFICGEDYQGQTVIELDTAERRDFLPPEAAAGGGFCWTEWRFDRESRLLVVCGCIWACPYEHRFYDFESPMERGWPQLETEGWIAAGDTAPLIEGARITTHETVREGDRVVVVATKTFERVEQKLVLVSAWIDDSEMKRRAARRQ